MALGFPPKHQEILLLGGLKPEEFLFIAEQVAQKKNWQISSITDHSLTAYTHTNGIVWSSEFQISLEPHLAEINSTSMGSEIWDLGKNKRIAKGFITAFEKLKEELSEEEIAQGAADLQARKMHRNTEEFEVTPSRFGAFRSFGSLFIPVEGYYITPILVCLNVAIFILMALSGANIFRAGIDYLLVWGGNHAPYVIEGQWWRLITAMFLHSGIEHLLFNMYALVYVGVLLEPILGRKRFLLSYGITGILAGINSLYWHDYGVCIGASGAIFGMYGVFIALLTTDIVNRAVRKTFLISIVVFTTYNLIMGLKGNVDNAGHIGGLLSGLLLGYVLLPELKRKTETCLTSARNLSIMGTALFITFLALFFYPTHQTTYKTQLEKFAQQERIALEAAAIEYASSPEMALQNIKEKAIPAWEKNLEIVKGFDQLDLTQKDKKRNKLLKEYCEKRLETMRLLCQYLEENDEAYYHQISLIDVRLTEILHEVSDLKISL